MQSTINTNSVNTKTKILYYGSTALLTLIMLFSASQYFFNHEFIRGAFQHLGYPTYLIYPMAVSKILGLIAIWSRKSQFLTGLAYAGFFYNVILAFFAHIAVSDHSQWIAVAAIIALVPSYFSSKKLFS